MEKAPFSMQCTGSTPSYAIFQNSDMCYLCFGPLNQAPINYYSVILRSNITIIIIYALFSACRSRDISRSSPVLCTYANPCSVYSLCAGMLPLFTRI